jgi:hypothetical protein
MKERLAAHRIRPACASCHDRIDPMGFALENFDVLGRWRTEESGRPVEATGQLPDGTAFDGVDGLRKLLMDRKEDFLRNLGRKMFGYALGRGLTLEDHCVVEQILAALPKSGYSAQTMVQGIVESEAFRK